ncbi:MAG TPA: LysM peptidoglycan-binding domain-containing protein [Anaerolineales bacterium]|nr:LysM peptidoglycan-binding domain-containing protein [Anaerolineales bacterium]
METIDLTELTYRIQEGRFDNPDTREALIRLSASDLFNLAFDLHRDTGDRAENALGITVEVFREALADPRRLREFESIRNWLYSLLVGRLRKFARGSPFLRRSEITKPGRLALVLRYGHGMQMEDIAEVIRGDPEDAHRHLRRYRRRLGDFRKPGRAGHIGSEIEAAVDERIRWTELPVSGHLGQCADCRGYLRALQDFGSEYSAGLANDRPVDLPRDTVPAILEHLAHGTGSGSHSYRLPVLEAVWAAVAVAVLLVIFQSLNPLLTLETPSPLPTPTARPAEPASDGLRKPDYAVLEEQLAVWVPWPSWHRMGTTSGTFPSTTGIAFSRGGVYAAFGSFNDVVLWDLGAGVETPLEGHHAVVTALAFGGDRWLATGAEEGTVRVWDLIEGRIRFVLEDAPRPISSVAFSPDMGLLAAGGNSGVTIWRFSKDAMVAIERLDGEFIRSLAFSPTGDLFAAADRSGAINVWRLPDFEHILKFAARQRFNTAIAFSPGGNRIATASMDRTVKVFRLTVTGQGTAFSEHIFTFDHPTWVSDLAWIGDHLLLTVAGSHENSVSNLGKRGLYFWEMVSGLPADLPMFLEDDGGIMTVSLIGENRLHLGSYNRAVHVLELDSPISDIEPQHFARSAGGLGPLRAGLRTDPEPNLEREFPLTFVAALEYLGYAQVLAQVLTEAVPAALAPRGAAYDPLTGTAIFAFSRTFALGYEEWIFLQIRRADDPNDFPFREDWIGSDADVEPLQFGRYLGEKVTGEWLPAAVDGGADGILRWTETGLTRFRWRQDGFLIELISRSEIGTEISRWTSLFLPIILPLVGADDTSPLVEYTVADGDSCSAIAARFGTTVGRITGLNGLAPGCPIFIGQTLQLPLPPAFGRTFEYDLDCDGVTERLRTIPDPRQPRTDLYIGFILEDTPGTGETEADYAASWTYAVPEVELDFFEPPVILSFSRDCQWYIAITGYGGGNSGLRIFSWNGETMELLLDTGGFLTGDYRFLDGGVAFQTRKLSYDSSVGACTETLSTYMWRDGEFRLVDEAVTSGVDCFGTVP